MTATQPAPQPTPRSNAALALLLVLSNLVFLGCVASRCMPTSTDWPETAGQPARMVLAEG
jgi:hypothetical protein